MPTVRPFNIISAIIHVPADMDAEVVVAWLHENYATLSAVVHIPGGDDVRTCVRIESKEACRLNDVLNEMQGAAPLLRHRTVDADLARQASVYAHVEDLVEAYVGPFSTEAEAVSHVERCRARGDCFKLHGFVRNVPAGAFVLSQEEDSQPLDP